MGVYSRDLTGFMAGALQNLGSMGAYVVHGHYETGAGLDELTTSGPSDVTQLKDGQISSFELHPDEYGFPRATLHDLQGGDATVNARLARELLSGQLTGPKLDVVLLNAGAAIALLEGEISAGIQKARESVDTGAALDRLDRYVAKTRSFEAG